MKDATVGVASSAATQEGAKLITLAGAQGGLGVEENIVTVCRFCHGEMDNGKNTKIYKEKARDYLMRHYPDWDEKKLIYSKW